MTRDGQRSDSSSDCEKKFPCGICNALCKSGSLECGRCRNWFHLGCVGVPAAVLTHLAKVPGLYWNCSHCQQNPSEIVPNTVCDLIDAKMSEPIDKMKSLCSDILAIKEFFKNQESVLKTEVFEIKDSVKSKRADFEKRINDSFSTK